MRRSERQNNLQICPRRDSNTSGSDLWSNTLPLDHGGAPDLKLEADDGKQILVKEDGEKDQILSDFSSVFTSEGTTEIPEIEDTLIRKPHTEIKV